MKQPTPIMQKINLDRLLKRNGKKVAEMGGVVLTFDQHCIHITRTPCIECIEKAFSATEIFWLRYYTDPQ